MFIQYTIHLAQQQPSHNPAAKKLITSIPKRMLRKADMDSIKRYVATQHNLAYEEIESMEPFYR